MKCDDDTFIRIDAILKDIEDASPESSLYLGNLNLLHRPLRAGKWAVTYEVHSFPCVRMKTDFRFAQSRNAKRWLLSCLQEWPEEIYPPYANGPGYVISSDIAKYIVSQHAKHSLRVCNTC